VKKAALLILMIVLAVVALALSVLPTYLLAPHQSHTPDDLAFAFRMRAWVPWLVAGVAALSLILGIVVWRQPRRSGAVRRILLGAALVVFLIPMVVAAAISRGMIIERMFVSVSEVELETPASLAVDDDEMVMGISIAGESRAYPIRIVGYHHIVHDIVGGEPVAATY